MEHHEAVYEQMIEVNSTNQGTEFISQQLVQEIVVQNDNQGSAVNCEIPGIEIMLPNDCVNAQEQCNSNILISCNTDGIGQENHTESIVLQTESNDVETISQMNNVDGNSTGFSENHEEVKVEEFVLTNQPSYQSQENFDISNTVLSETNQETIQTETVSETVQNSSESVPLINTNDSVPASVHNESIGNHILINSENITENISEVENQNLKNESDVKIPEQNLANVFANEKETETFINSIQVDNIESMEIETVGIVSDVVNDNVIVATEEPQTQAENHCPNEEVKKEDNTMFANNSDVNSKNEETKSEISSEKVEYSVLITETLKETKIVTNSDDVAILTEFSSVEFTSQEDIPPKEIEVESQSKTKVVELKSEEIEATLSNKNEIKVESNAEKPEENDVSSEQMKKNDTSLYDQLTNNDDEEDELDLHLSTQSTDSHRKVIQDIFDDWQDENGDEENNQSSTMFKEHQDSVEMELQNLLNDGAQQEQVISSSNTVELNSYENFKEPIAGSTPGKEKVIKTEKLSPLNKTGSDSKTLSNKSPKSNYSPTKDNSISRSPKDQAEIKPKLQSPRPGVKIPGLHLTSQIASTAEVNEVLKERLREKQKDLVTPKTADIVFVKKITQRLSSQLSAAGPVAVPPRIPLQTTLADLEGDKNKSIEETKVEPKKSATSTDKELLAILEGDVDPDWSNLKPHTTQEKSSNKVSSSEDSHGSSTKLDPVVERELALKQLLELPNITTKKPTAESQKKPTKRNVRSSGKSNKQTESNSEDNDSKEIISLDSAEEDSPKKSLKETKENNNQNTRSSATADVELGVEESRSGRKRKLTEKAREHELTVKRQKVFKGKVAETKKTSQESSEVTKQKNDISTSTPKESESADEQTTLATPKSSQTKSETKQSKPDVKASKAEIKTTPSKAEAKQTAAKAESKSGGIKGKITALKRSKIGLLKKDAPISKRKLVVKNLLRQKKAAASTKSPISTKTSSPNKSSVRDKSPTSAPVSKPKKVTEIDRLLQDEGVVNLLYDVEQPDLRKRLVPITKSQKKVMDVEKAERELSLRKKLVKNAVMRLRNSSVTTAKISPRSRRNATADQASPQTEKKSKETTKSSSASAAAITTSASTPSDFIIPAKIRNAADASRIIRRHSSSSFSSASASPRVSIDQPPESVKSDDLEPQTKSKRKLSQDTTDKLDLKKTKKKASVKSESESETSEKTPVKKITRSNVATSPSVAATTKTVSKSKKVPKNKSSTDSISSDIKSSPKGQDELSACLAEAASVLSNISGTSRSSSASSNRKKGSTNLSKSIDEERVDIKKLFSNKEINVKQHGHLVQLILTPSAPVSGIRNAITIQVMNEIREALSILKKDDDCRVVLFTSTGTSFCEGLELSSLLHSNKEERKIRVEEMTNAVKEFIRVLATFNKPIVAGVQGAAIGLGVTMLPLFDLVIASDKATFSTPYGKLGQIAEGAAVLTLSHSLGSAMTNELLLGGRVLTANEALRAGLVTRVLWPDRFQGELLPSLKAMSEQSSQSMEATKALLRHSLRKKLDAALEAESFLLIQHWCSLECQEAIKAYIDEKGQ